MVQEIQKKYEKLIEMIKEITLLDSCQALLHWDEGTYLPSKGNKHRAMQLSFLSKLAYEKLVSKEIGELLLELENSSLMNDPLSVQAVNIRELRREYDRFTKVPIKLVEELSKTISFASKAWISAKQNSDFKIFQPYLEELIKLKKEEIGYITGGKIKYDTFINDYEPGESVEDLNRIFNPLKDELIKLIDEIRNSKKFNKKYEFINLSYPIELQKSLSMEAAKAVGFDFEAGRMDETVHSVCINIGPGDTRLLVGFSENTFFDSFFGTLHEAGHGIYIQGLNSKEYYGTLMGREASSGIHESQSRMFENLVGRSHPFWVFFYPKFQKTFPNIFEEIKLEDFYFAINQVNPSFIRVDADEVTYNLHILLRIEIEQALFEGNLKVSDIPDFWNNTFKKYLWMTPTDDSQGCLQDMHWSAGMFGYFPTYTLGNLYAAQLFEKVKEEIPNLEEEFKKGNFLQLKNWLDEKIYQHGRRYRAKELIKNITGKPLSHEPFINYLKNKYKPLYEI